MWRYFLVLLYFILFFIFRHIRKQKKIARARTNIKKSWGDILRSYEKTKRLIGKLTVNAYMNIKEDADNLDAAFAGSFPHSIAAAENTEKKISDAVDALNQFLETSLSRRTDITVFSNKAKRIIRLINERSAAGENIREDEE